MNVGGMNNYWLDMMDMMGYGSRRTQRAMYDNDFARGLFGAAQAGGVWPSANLRGSDETTGDIAVSSWADVKNGSTTTIYKTRDFDPENPVYKVRTWDTEGKVTEQMVDASKIDPKNCNTVEMYVYAANLKEEGKGDFKETVLKTTVAKAAADLNRQSTASWDYYRSLNWVNTVKDLMQSAYGYGDYKGYMEWNKFLGFLGR